jgi:predicted phage terminase large subunit-like protein
MRASRLAAVPRDRLRKALAALTPQEALALAHDWEFWARPEQLPPRHEKWRTWLILAGRGWGKTRVGAEWIHRQAMARPGRRLALVGRTAADVRDTMIRGESGIESIAHPAERPEYVPSQRVLRWPNGSTALTFSADKPDQLRGPQHEIAWCDELAAWRYDEAWDQLQFGLRLGRRPQVIVTTTPRPTAIIRRLVKERATHVTRGRTHDNRANLAPDFVAALEARYGGTRLGRQELEAEILDDDPRALWRRTEMLDAHRVREVPVGLKRVVVAIDPAVTATDESDETGIVVAGLGDDGRGYVLDDLSGRYSPDEWARRAIDAYRRHEANTIVAEANQGGDMISTVLSHVDAAVPVALVRASRGKATRAEPISALYEQGRVSHVGSLPALEDQLCAWVPGESSPDRLDALVWALSDLMLGAPGSLSFGGDAGAFGAARWG